MNKQKRQRSLNSFVLLFIVLFILINNASYTKAAADLSKETTDTIFADLKENNAAAAYSVFSLKNPDVNNLSTESLSIKFNEVCGHVKSYQILTSTTCNDLQPEYETTTICNENINGSTYCHDEKTLKGYTEVSYICEKPIKSIPAGLKDYRITADIELPRNDKGELIPCSDGHFGYKIDWIPSIIIQGETFEQKAWSWWNSTLDEGLFYYYNGSVTNSKMLDYKGRYNITFAGTPTVNTTGKLDYGVRATSNTNYMIYNTSGLGAVSQYTLNFWINTTYLGDYGRLLKGGAIDLYMDYGGGIRPFDLRGTYLALSVANCPTFAEPYFFGSWNTYMMVTITYNGSLCTLYRNAVVNASGAGSGTLASLTSIYMGSDGAGHGFNQTWDEIGIWNRSLSADEVNFLYNNGTALSPVNTSPTAPASPAIAYGAGTSTAGTYFNATQNSITIITTVTSFAATNTTHYLYKNGVLNQSVVNSSTGNFTSVFSNLPPANYTINAKTINSTNEYNTTNRTIVLYYAYPTIITPANNTIQSRLINISYNLTVTPANAISAAYYNITLLNDDLSINATLKANNSLNLSYYWNISNNASFKPGNYYMMVIVNFTDGAGTSTQNNFSLNQTAPTTPSFALQPSAWYYNYLTNFIANGSTDIDGDTITILYKITDVDAGVIRQNYSTTASYTATVNDVGHNLTVTALASTSTLNSSSVTVGALTYLTLANFTIIREKTGLLLNVSHADEMSLSIICLDDVNTRNITANNFSQNISCAYQYIKIDATFGNVSYFRIINPAYAAFAAIPIYMLDLTIDTGVEIILTIDDLTGDYDQGKVIIKRYINSSEVTIISYPVDIESSATLYLLKDALYTVTVEDNDGNQRVLGNLIASSAGSKTITLPDINFYPSDAVFGQQLNWSYNYFSNSSYGFIELNYYDYQNSTLNVTFIIINASNQAQVFGSTSTNGSYVSFTYVLPDPNATYLSNLTIARAGLPNMFEQKIFYPGQEIMPAAETGLFDDAATYLFWIALIFIFIIGLAFSATSSKIGLVVVMFFLLMFISWRWIDFGASTWIVFGLFGILVVFNLISRSKEVKG